MQQIGIGSHAGVTPFQATLLGRFAVKLVVDVVPAALASLLVGYLLSQYQFGHASWPAAAARRGSPASAEMMQLVRDEHAAIMDYLKSQAAAEKSRYAAEDEADAQAAADAEAAAAAERRRVPASAAAMVASQPVASHRKARVSVAASTAPPRQGPVVLAQGAQNDGATGVESAPPSSQSLLARTIDIKDHVVHATLHAVSAIGGIPNWIASLGDRIGGGADSPDRAQQFSAPS
jgi:hypothetical protein